MTSFLSLLFVSAFACAFVEWKRTEDLGMALKWFALVIFLPAIILYKLIVLIDEKDATTSTARVQASRASDPPASE